MTLQEKLELFNQLLDNQSQEFKNYLLYCYYDIGERLAEISTPQQLCSYFFEMKISYYTKLQISWDLLCLDIYGEDPEFKEFIFSKKQQILRELTAKSYEQVLKEFREIFKG